MPEDNCNHQLGSHVLFGEETPISKSLRKHLGQSPAGSGEDKENLGNLFSPAIRRKIKYGVVFGDRYMLLKFDTGEPIASAKKSAERAEVTKIPGIPLITKREVIVLLNRLSDGL